MLISPLTVVSFTDRIKTYIAKDSIETQPAEIFDTEKKVEKIENIELDYFSDTSMTADNDPMLDFVKENIIQDLDVNFEEEKIKIDNEKTDMEPFSPSMVYVGGEKGMTMI